MTTQTTLHSSADVALLRVATAAALLCVSLSPALAQVQNTTSLYEYDPFGNRTKVTDPRGKSTTQTFDMLNRPALQTQPPATTGGATPTVTTGFDLIDQMQSVTDPRSLNTTYTTSGLGVTTQQISPDTGTTGATYDAAGNVKSLVDARAKTATYTYDALNRLTAVSYPTGVASSFEYDGGATPPANSKGRLTKIADESGNTTFTYDAFGRVLTKTQTAGTGASAKVRTVTYAYGTSGTALGRLTSITYPSWNRINFSYDTAGRVSGVTLNPTASNGASTNTASTITLMSAIAYHPFGLPVSWTWGNARPYTRTVDLDGRVAGYPIGDGSQSGLIRTVAYDAASRITGYTHINGSNVAQPTFTQTFGYDDLNRLTSWTAASTSQSYGYDLTGNRSTLTVGATNYTYTTAAASNRLSSTTGPVPAQTNIYDARGSLTSNAEATLTYSDRGRMATSKIGTNTTTYRYNALEQRVSKTGPTAVVPTGAIYFVYDESSRLIGEYNATNQVRNETVYLDDLPVAVLTQTVTGTAPNLTYTTVVNYAFADQINTTRAVTRASDNKLVWRWDQADPFGSSLPNENPSALGAFSYNFRFPGQYYDSESKLTYNVNRDYDSRIGRYVQSDPIGLSGGMDTYAYVDANPVSRADAEGLAPPSVDGSFRPLPILRPGPFGTLPGDPGYQSPPSPSFSYLIPESCEARCNFVAGFVCGPMVVASVLASKIDKVSVFVGCRAAVFGGCRAACEKNPAKCDIDATQH